MERILKSLMLCALLAGCAGPRTLSDQSKEDRYSPPPGAIVLRVEVLDVEFTDLSLGCAEPRDCIPFHFWYKYRARVKETVSGEWNQAQVEFARLQHAQFIDEVTRDCYVVLVPTSPDMQSLLKVSFEADRLVSPVMDGGRAEIKALRNGAKHR